MHFMSSLHTLLTVSTTEQTLRAVETSDVYDGYRHKQYTVQQTAGVS